MSETPPDDPLRFDAPDAPAGGAHVRVLIIQSDVAPAESVAEAFPPIRYLVTYATDPLTVVATAVSRDIDVVVLDTPSYDVEVDSLLWRLDSESIRLPIVVVGSSPPPQPMRVRFPVRYLPKPVDPVRLAAEVESVLADAEAVRSAAVPLPPEQAAGRSKHPSGDFPEWTRMTRELARETGELVIAAPAPAPGAAEAPDVRIVEPPRTAPAPPAEPPAGAGAVPIERVLSVGERDAVGPPALAGRSAAVAGSDPAITSGLGVVLRDAGMDVREVAREPLAALPEIRARPPDVVAVDPGTRDDVARVLQALRADVRLWHRPIVVVSARPDVLDAARLLGRGADEALRAEAPEREILSKIGVLLAPLEQAREHIAKDRTASGEIGPVGVVAVVRIAAATRREARAVLRGDGRLAEIDLLDGQIAAVRLTEPDGRYATGVEALTPMLALRSGRWSVRPLPLARPGASLRLPIPGALWDAADRLTELLSHATPDLVLRVRRLRLRERAGAARGFSAAEIRARERLQTGDAPRTLLGAPGMTVDGIARLVEKLILAGEVAALEEEEAGRIDVTTAPAGAAAARPAAELPAALFRTGRPSEGPCRRASCSPPRGRRRGRGSGCCGPPSG
jgi:DNA-binding response OmpR family regulator